MLWCFGYGIIPSFIFGFSSTLIRKFLDRSNCTMDNIKSITMTTTSRSPAGLNTPKTET